MLPRTCPLRTEHQELSLWELGVAAVGAGFAGSFVVTPVERVKVVMQAMPTGLRPFSRLTDSFARGAVRAGAGVTGGGAAYANAWVCAKSLVAEQGLFRGLYAGFSPTLWRHVPG